jgi:hypothetical protein
VDNIKIDGCKAVSWFQMSQDGSIDGLSEHCDAAVSNLCSADPWGP